jgi:serine/threonine protein kinase
LIRTIRKPLPASCLLHGKIHPSIIERLQRVQQLPVANAAILQGIEPDESGYSLVWQWIEGTSLDQILQNPIDPSTARQIADDLQLLLESLHAHGIVHGALHARNIIVDSKHGVHITHLSPLLYDDVAADWETVSELLGRLGKSKTTHVQPLQDSGEDVLFRRNHLLAAATVTAGAIVTFFIILWYIRG